MQGLFLKCTFSPFIRSSSTQHTFKRVNRIIRPCITNPPLLSFHLSTNSSSKFSDIFNFLGKLINYFNGVLWIRELWSLVSFSLTLEIYLDLYSSMRRNCKKQQFQGDIKRVKVVFEKTTYEEAIFISESLWINIKTYLFA